MSRRRLTPLRRFLATDGFAEHMELHRADCVCSHGDLSCWAFCRAKLEAFANEPVPPEPLIRGRDLIEAGYAPGPRCGEILRWAEDGQLEGTLTDRAAALAAVRERFPPEARGDG